MILVKDETVIQKERERKRENICYKGQLRKRLIQRQEERDTQTDTVKKDCRIREIETKRYKQREKEFAKD